MACLQERGIDVELEDPAIAAPDAQLIYILLPQSSVEVWFHQEKAVADATADGLAELAPAGVFQTDTVVEDWAVRPSPEERAPIKECVSGK